ncbi:MAG: energy-coupled thiamine transporter ThiT [Christensenellaceae bacterium]|jgi:thiamine transporter|nr:energy-coupled thiamine transporter ThiT [Christensenellaceae bacterium]
MEFVLFKKLASLEGVEVWLLLAALAVAAVLLLGILRYRRSDAPVPAPRANATRALVYGALCVSLSFILSYVKLFSLPMGGSITLCAMLPVAMYAAMFGPRYGFVAGLALGVLQLMQDFYVVHWAQLILDYFIAYACYGLASLFPKQLRLGLLAAGVGRLICSTLSGVIFFAEYAEGWGSVWAYSLAYNGSYIGAETLLCVIIASLPALKRLMDTMQTGRGGAA